MQSAIGVLGLGNLGTALAYLITHQYPDQEVWGWTHTQFTAWQINHDHLSPHLSGVKLDWNLKATNYLEELFAWSEIIFLTLPSCYLWPVITQALPFIKPHHILINTAKGLEETQSQPAYAKLSQLLPASQLYQLSGPMIALELAQHQLSTGLIAGSQPQPIIDLFKPTALKLQAYQDPLGLSWAGVLKNVYAIGLGMLDQLNHNSLNTRGWYLSLAFQEMTQFFTALKLNPTVLTTPAGLGDLVSTALSPHSHNQTYGKCLIQHKIVPHTTNYPEGHRTLQILFNSQKLPTDKLKLAAATHQFIEQKIDTQTWLEKSLHSG